MTATNLFAMARTLREEDADRHIYLANAFHNGLSNYRIVNLYDISKAGVREEMPRDIYNFIGRHGEVLLIANIVCRKIVSLIIRSLREKEFRVWGQAMSFPYGLPSELSCFGLPIILVEGPLDRDSLIQIFPNVVATLKAGTTQTQRDILLTLTNKFIIAYDNDEAGQNAMRRDRKFFRDQKCKVGVLEYPTGIKDAGTLSEFTYYKMFDKRDDLLLKIRAQLQSMRL